MAESPWVVASMFLLATIDLVGWRLVLVELGCTSVVGKVVDVAVRSVSAISLVATIGALVVARLVVFLAVDSLAGKGWRDLRAGCDASAELAVVETACWRGWAAVFDSSRETAVEDGCASAFAAI